MFDALTHESADQVLGNATEPKAADHDRCAVGDVAHCFVGISNDLVHEKEILNEN
jgi:hypothetical protein